MVEESERRAKEAEVLRMDLIQAKLQEKEAKDKLIDLLRNPAMATPVMSYHPPPASNGTNIYIRGNIHPANNNIKNDAKVAYSFPNIINSTTIDLPTPPTYQQTNNYVTRDLRSDLNSLRIATESPYRQQVNGHTITLSSPVNSIKSPMNASISSVSSPMITSISTTSINSNYTAINSPMNSSISSNGFGLPATSCDLLTDADVEKLAFEIEKERIEYLEKSKHLHNQLRDLKSEIQVSCCTHAVAHELR